jgi:hypothetical protein
MLVGIQKALAWATAFAAVFAFYAHSVFGLPSYQVTPVSAAAVAVGLIGMAYFGFLELRYRPPESRARQASSFLLALALLLALASTVAHAFADEVLTPEWGVAGVALGVPILIGFCNVRKEFLRAIGTVCVGFASVDLTLDVLDYSGIANVANHVGEPGSAYGLHYLGAAGSSFATGLVGFLAVSFVASGFAVGTLTGNLARVAIMAALICSVYLTGTRIYLAASLASAAVFVAPGNRRTPLVLCSAAIAALFLYMTFNYASGDRDNALRWMLLLDGFDGALRHPLLGSGPSYIDSGSLTPTYQALNAVGVVESGFAQFAIFYGLPAAVCLVAGSLAAQGARRARQSFASVVLCLITAIFVFNAPIGSFLGSIAFYTPLIYCQRDELCETAPS